MHMHMEWRRHRGPGQQGAIWSWLEQAPSRIALPLCSSHIPLSFQFSKCLPHALSVTRPWQQEEEEGSRSVVPPAAAAARRPAGPEISLERLTRSSWSRIQHLAIEKIALRRPSALCMTREMRR